MFPQPMPVNRFADWTRVVSDTDTQPVAGVMVVGSVVVQLSHSSHHNNPLVIPIMQEKRITLAITLH